MSTSVPKALPGKLDIKRHSPSILYLEEGKTSHLTNTRARVHMTGVNIANNGTTSATTAFGRVWLLMEIQTRIQVKVLVVTQTVVIPVDLHPGAWI